MHRSLLVTLLLVVVPAPGQAQVVHGRVVGVVTREPIAGALILLLDAARRERARTATQLGGAYSVTAPEAGQYVLVALRIGYPKWQSPRFRLAAGQTLEYTIDVPEEPSPLDAITVQRETSCRVGQEGGEAVGRLWEEARTALALAEVTKREGRYLFHTMTTERLLSERLYPLEEARVTDFGLARWSYVSQPAESLARYGFVRDSAGQVRYHGPDVDVLFASAFLEHHCFRQRKGRDPDLIGLAFEPVRGRSLPDIEGVLWLDRRTAALKRLEFSYTNLESWIPPSSAVGQIEYDVLPTGAWIIRRWLIRAPGPRVTGGQVVGIGRFLETRGQVAAVLRPNGQPVARYPPEP